jgi:hypothetical protein
MAIMTYFQYSTQFLAAILTICHGLSVRQPLFSHISFILHIRRQAVNYTRQTHTVTHTGHQLPPIYEPNNVMKRTVIIMECSITPCPPPPPNHNTHRSTPAAMFLLNNISDLVLQPMTSDMVPNSKSVEV